MAPATDSRSGYDVDGAETRAGDNRRLIEQVIEQHVTERAAQWFPDFRGPPTVRLRRVSSRPRSVLFAVIVKDGFQERRVLAKVRRGEPAPVTVERSGGRPRLSTDTPSASELTGLEYDGLRSIFRTFGTTGSSFGAIRPLDHLAAENTILMDYVEGRTLRQILVDQSRLSPHRRSVRRRDPENMLQQAGAWLRTFQQSMPHHSLPARQPTRQDVVDRFDAYHEFLTTRLGASSFGDLARRGADLAEDVLPDQLPMAVGHGDYAPRNVLVSEDGRLTVFDPMPRWVVPCLEDLCRFLVGIRLLGLQLHTHGVAYRRCELEHYEQQVIRGYYAEGPVPVAQLRCYELLIMLDKWSALVDMSHQGWRARVRTMSIELATGYLRGQAQRLLDLSASSTP